MGHCAKPGDKSISRTAIPPVVALPDVGRIQSGLKWSNSAVCRQSVTRIKDRERSKATIFPAAR